MSQTTYLHYASFLISQHHQSMGHGQGHVYISNATMKSNSGQIRLIKVPCTRLMFISPMYHLCLKKWKKICPGGVQHLFICFKKSGFVSCQLIRSILCEWLLWLALTQREGIQNIQRNLSPNSVAWSPLQKASHWPRAQKVRYTQCPAGLCSIFSAYNYNLPWTIPAADLSHIWTVSLHISSWERWSASSEEKKKCYTENTIQQQNCIYICPLCSYLCVYNFVYI